MRALILSHSSAVENLGGAERSMLEFLDGWRSERPDTELLVVAREPQGFLQPELDRRGIPWMTLTFNSWVLPQRLVEAEDIYRATREDFAATRALERLIREFKPDVVATNTIVSPWAAIAAKLVGVPHIWFAHEYGDDHEFALSVDETFEDIGTLSDLVVCSSRQLKDYLVQWVPAGEMDVLYPEIDISRLDALAKDRGEGWRDPFTASSEGHTLRVVCVGRIAQSKGQDKLLRAIAGLKAEGVAVELALVGNATPEDNARISKLITDLNIGDRVALTGEVANPHPYIAAADVGAVVSASEGFGRVTVEYMAARKAVVGARVGATPELVVDGETGILVEPGNADDLVAALRTYAQQPGLAVAHGAAGREFLQNEVVERHRLPALLARIDGVVQAGSSPVPRLPHLYMSWMNVPAVALEYLRGSEAGIDLRSSMVWKIGRIFVGGTYRIGRLVPRRLRRLVRRGRAA